MCSTTTLTTTLASFVLLAAAVDECKVGVDVRGLQAFSGRYEDSDASGLMFSTTLSSGKHASIEHVYKDFAGNQIGCWGCSPDDVARTMKKWILKESRLATHPPACGDKGQPHCALWAICEDCPIPFPLNGSVSTKWKMMNTGAVHEVSNVEMSCCKRKPQLCDQCFTGGKCKLGALFYGCSQSDPFTKECCEQDFHMPLECKCRAKINMCDGDAHADNLTAISV
eukprot:TRINITY_DN27569_c0_g1_i1.p1 TRINITY_DN27569_c0_g1~~TRINITY_DN27569_c0_g1_i1.p1  ORF type:complete len:225 (-),score=39.05 TRINITY_DN27569_c0_g1_i1:429-1103(-)